MKLLNDNGNPCNLILVYEYNGHKFRMNCDHFWECSLCIMSNNGVWKQIETNRSVNVSWKNLSFLDGKNPTECAAANRPVIEAFKKYITSVY